MAKIKKSDNNKCWQVCRATGGFIHFLMKMYTDITTWKNWLYFIELITQLIYRTTTQLIIALNTQLIYNLPSPLLGIYSREIKTYDHASIQSLTCQQWKMYNPIKNGKGSE